jgi:hypothetical protein
MSDAAPRSREAPLSEYRELPGAERPTHAGQRAAISMRLPGRGQAQSRWPSMPTTLTHLTRYFPTLAQLTDESFSTG